MAGSKSNFLESAVLNYWLGKSFTSTAPANVFVRLHNSTVSDSVTGATDQLAATAANYVEASVTNSSASWTNSTSGGSKTNKVTITFTTAASTGWGTVQSFSISDSSSTSAGNVLYWGDLTTPQAVAAGNIVRFSTGAIVISED